MAGSLPMTGTIGEVVRLCTGALVEAGIAGAGNEARWLVAAALGCSSAALLSRSNDVLQTSQAAAIAAFLDRRLRHEPLSRIVGRREFYGRDFEVSPATLDPRPDTETLIDALLQVLDDDVRREPLRLIDVGTGTGCIPITLALELPAVHAVATDVSAAALKVARRNALRLGVAERITFVETDLAGGIAGPFDVLVSNPPYIRSGDIAALDAAVQTWDPHLALDGGSDGLNIYRRLAADALNLVPDGWILLETGYDQAPDVATILRSALPAQNLGELRTFADVAGIPRVVAARTRTT